jgi:hypothetical protein
LVNLSEEDGLIGSVEGTPFADAAFETSAVGVLELVGVLLLEPGEEGLGLESWFGLEFGFDFGPDLGEGVGSSAVGSWSFLLAGECVGVLVFASGFGGHGGIPCGLGEGHSVVEFPKEGSNLSVRDHGGPSWSVEVHHGRERRGGTRKISELRKFALRKEQFSIHRRPLEGIPIVAKREK